MKIIFKNGEHNEEEHFEVKIKNATLKELFDKLWREVEIEVERVYECRYDCRPVPA